MSLPLVDQLARSLADKRLSRRAAVESSMAAVVASVVVDDSGSAQQATPEIPVDDPGFGQPFLFVQTFTGGAFGPNPVAGTPVAEETPEAGMHGDYLLSLGGHPGQTVYFSERPERIVGDVPTDRFVAGLGFESSNPPNAALVTQNLAGETVVAVVELMNPVVDVSAGTVVYEVVVLDEYTDDGLRHLIERNEADAIPEEFGAASLYIDDCPNAPVWCYPQGATCEFQPTYIGHGSAGTCWSWSKFNCVSCRSTADWCDDHFAECDNACWALGYDCEQGTA